METARLEKLVLICALGAITACNGEEALPGDAGVDGPVTPDGGSTTAVAGAAGGTFTFYGGKVTLEVPAGALSKDITIRVLALVSYPQDSRLVPGTAYDLLPDGTTFNKAVKLSITYDQASVPSGVAEADLRIHKVISGSWKLISGGGADAKANVAWANLKGFSKYGVAGPKPATVDGMVDAGVDTAVPVDGAKPDVPKDDAKPDSPKSDLPKPDLPLPDLPKPPDMPQPPDMPLPPDLPVPDLPKPPDMPQPPDMPLPPDMPVPPDAPLPDTLAPDTSAPPACVIGGQSFSKGAKHPGGCAQCDPAKSTTAWTVTTNGCLIYNVCKKSGDKDLGGCATCNPSKSKTAYTLLPGKCRIDGTCYGSGAKHPKGCGSCDPSKSGTTWTPSGNNCVIDHACYASGAKHSAGCGTCDPSKSQTNWTVSGNKCLIGSTCRASGAKEPGGCGVCDPGKSKTSWSRPAGCLATFAWAKKFGDMQPDRPHGVAVDSSGNVYITGSFQDSISFGGTTFNATGPGYGWDVFLASFTPSGQHRWSKTFGGSGAGTAYDVAVDSKGNVTITGTFNTSIKFAGSASTHKAAGANDLFLASFTSKGTYRWSKTFYRSNKKDCDTKIAVDHGGNVYVTGSFTGTTSLGGAKLTSKPNQWDIYVASYTTTGAHRWSNSFHSGVSSSQFEFDYGMAVDLQGNVYVTGTFNGSINFGGVTHSGFYDVYLASFTTGGAFRWSNSYGGSSGETGHAVAVDTNSNVFLTGQFQKSVSFGGSTFTSNGLYSDVYVASYTSLGQHRWSRSFGSSHDDNSYGIVADSAGNAYVTGYYSISADFGGGTFTTKGGHDMFIASYSAKGKHRWSRSLGGSTSGDMGNAMGVDSTGDAYMVGRFMKTVDFGGGPVTSAGSVDIVLLKLSQ